MTSLADRVAIVTGAGAGIGRGIALALASNGANVVVTGRNMESTGATVEEILGRGGRALGIECDVTDRGAVELAVTRTIDTFGRLDVTVHNAAGDLPDVPWPVERITIQQWDSLAAPSIRGTFDFAQASYPHLRHTAGRFVVITSSVGMSGSAALPVYACVKALQRGLVKALAREWGPAGVTVNCIGPLARTRTLEQSFAANPDAESMLLGRIPLRRLGDPETDIGPAVVFLASDMGRYVTGQTLLVDGGMFTGL